MRPALRIAAFSAIFSEGRLRWIRRASGGVVEVETKESPRGEYQRRLADRQRRAAQLARQERLLGNSRIAVFLIAVGMAYLAFGTNLLFGWWLLAPGAVFVVLLFVHENVTRSWRRAVQATAFYRDGIARLDGAWKGRGRKGERFLDEKHPYAADLDLFGAGSLFELLCTARTAPGEETLAAWLRTAAPAEEIRARQQATAELRPLLDLREDLALLAAGVPAGVHFDTVADWGAAAPVLTPRWPRWVALALGLLTASCLAGWLAALFGLLDPNGVIGVIFTRAEYFPFLIALILEGAFAGRLLSRVNQVLQAVERRGPDLAMLAGLLARLERASFTSPRLCALRAQLNSPHSAPPSQRIAQLGNLIEVLNSRRNQLFMPLAYLLLWGTQCAYAFEKWRAASGPAVGSWLRVVGEFEALSSLASYAYENPGDPFPEIVTDGPCYDGEGLAHPLLPTCVPNDLHLPPPCPPLAGGGGLGGGVLIVSGSNMSGKSTFLRTVGVNAVLALAGAPVRARRLRLSPLALGATLRIQDSLQEGRSRFYAEILRVRQVVDLSRGPLPLLFLLDEIFAGTNSHDRRLGAESVVRGLVEAGALGLVTTHDLSLTHIADQLGERAANVHFADHFENGVMTFDFRLQPGVVQHSNALALMRAVGLEV